MQGVVTDDKGAYVKAAIVKLIKIRDSNEESEPEAVTYAETDEEGRFLFQEINSDEKYFIEIYVDRSELNDKKDVGEADVSSEPATKMEVPEKEAESIKIDEPEKAEAPVNLGKQDAQDRADFDIDDPDTEDELEEEMIDFADGNGIIDHLKTNNMIDDKIRGSISICNLNYMIDLNLKEKSYLTKSNLW
ncbi:MAG TPA: hypothetical protein VEA58_01345 [Anaerovoracaceae bacterium]|nr:hypothetical protein [Anaerovoracaceae bacterium]